MEGSCLLEKVHFERRDIFCDLVAPLLPEMLFFVHDSLCNISNMKSWIRAEIGGYYFLDFSFA